METNKLLNKFEKYILIELGYIYKTYRGYKNSVINYLEWLSDNGIKPKKVTLDQLYTFIAYRKQRGDSDSYIKGFKSAITHFNHAIGMKSNPALMLRIAKCDRPTPTNIIDVEFLETIYRDTEANTLIHQRDRCILGIMIFQGLKRTELEVLQVEHLDIDNARLYVPSTRTTNERYIPLHPKQMMHLSQYIYDLRPKLLQYFRKETNLLFFSSGVANNLNGALTRMLRRIRLEYHYVKNFKQLTQSRLVIWINEYGLRQAQYWGGYRYVTSVKVYDKKTVDDLQRLLKIHHPMETMG